MTRRTALALTIVLTAVPPAAPQPQPARARHGMVAAQSERAAAVGRDVLRAGGNAVDAAVATAFALAVTYPAAGNIGGGGFLVYRAASGETSAYDFRETAPAAATATMFLVDGRYDRTRHHQGALSSGVPGTVAGLHLAWQDHGRRPWKQLLDPAVQLARRGFAVSEGLARSLKDVLPAMAPYPASVAQFSRRGAPYESGEVLRQPDLGRTLARIGASGPAGFYRGETAALVEKAMKGAGGLLTQADLGAYVAHRRTPLQGRYRGLDVVSMPPASAGGTALLEMLNILEGYDVASRGPGSAAFVHVAAEAMRRAYADRARFLGDPDFNPAMPIERLVSRSYAEELRRSIRENRASTSAPDRFEWPHESPETTHISVVDAEGNAVALTYTLEGGYGSRIVVPGAGFLLNNEMGDFNAGPGLTDREGLIGTEPNLAAPGKRMLSSMTPTILSKDGRVFMVVGAAGGRKIVNAVLLTILNVVDFGMNAQQAVDTPRFHHQWLPDQILHERWGLSADTLERLHALGHTTSDAWPAGSPTAVHAIVRRDGGELEGGVDRRTTDGAALGH